MLEYLASEDGGQLHIWGRPYVKCERLVAENGYRFPFKSCYELEVLAASLDAMSVKYELVPAVCLNHQMIRETEFELLRRRTIWSA